MSADSFEETLMGGANKDAEHHRRSASEKEVNICISFFLVHIIGESILSQLNLLGSSCIINSI